MVLSDNSKPEIVVQKAGILKAVFKLQTAKLNRILTVCFLNLSFLKQYNLILHTQDVFVRQVIDREQRILLIGT